MRRGQLHESRESRRASTHINDSLAVNLQLRSPLDDLLQHTHPRSLHTPRPVSSSRLDQHLSQSLLAQPLDNLGHHKVGHRVDGELADSSDKIGLPKQVEDPRRRDAEEKLEQVRSGGVSKEKLKVVGSGGRRSGGVICRSNETALDQRRRAGWEERAPRERRDENVRS